MEGGGGLGTWTQRNGELRDHPGVGRLKKGRETKAMCSVGSRMGRDGGRGKGFQRENERNELFQYGEVGETPLNL